MTAINTTTVSQGAAVFVPLSITSNSSVPAAPVRRRGPAVAIDGIEPRRQGPTNRSHRWYRIQNAADDEGAAEVLIYDEITDPFWAAWGDGISARSFREELAGLKGKDLTVRINSPGGSVFEGLAIYNTLRSHEGAVNVIVDGIAASIASVIAMAGDSVTMAPHSLMMIHEAFGFTMGDADDHRHQAEVLDKLSDDIAAVYRERGDSRINWRAKMHAETWLSDTEAVALGLADRIDTAIPAATNRFDLSRYANVPQSLVTNDGPDPVVATKRVCEDALRDAGLSAKEAKAVIARGWPTDRDDQTENAGATAQVVNPGAEDAGMVSTYPVSMARARLQLLAATAG